MGERMTSRADAAVLKRRIDALVDELEGEGFDRGTVASAMLGVSAGIKAVQDGTADTLAVLDRLKDVIVGGKRH